MESVDGINLVTHFQPYLEKKMDTLNLSGDPLGIPGPQLGRGEQEQTKCSAAANCLAAAATGEHKVEWRRGEQQTQDLLVDRESEHCQR